MRRSVYKLKYSKGDDGACSNVIGYPLKPPMVLNTKTSIKHEPAFDYALYFTQKT